MDGPSFCDRCHGDLVVGDAQVSLLVIGPDQDLRPRILSHYCEPCWSKVIVLIECFEELHDRPTDTTGQGT
jgi:hypothetical protein